ncbi:MAG: hypothetical protein KDD62_04715 [Bdellovibrionales bacterium]|nr:hypothetical protein [Bdellovibrionales bacterium]
MSKISSQSQSTNILASIPDDSHASLEGISGGTFSFDFQAHSDLLAPQLGSSEALHFVSAPTQDDSLDGVLGGGRSQDIHAVVQLQTARVRGPLGIGPGPFDLADDQDQITTLANDRQFQGGARDLEDFSIEAFRTLYTQSDSNKRMMQSQIVFVDEGGQSINQNLSLPAGASAALREQANELGLSIIGVRPADARHGEYSLFVADKTDPEKVYVQTFRLSNLRGFNPSVNFKEYLAAALPEVLKETAHRLEDLDKRQLAYELPESMDPRELSVTIDPGRPRERSVTVTTEASFAIDRKFVDQNLGLNPDNPRAQLPQGLPEEMLNILNRRGADERNPAFHLKSFFDRAIQLGGRLSGDFVPVLPGSVEYLQGSEQPNPISAAQEALAEIDQQILGIQEINGRTGQYVLLTHNPNDPASDLIASPFSIPTEGNQPLPQFQRQQIIMEALGGVVDRLVEENR